MCGAMWARVHVRAGSRSPHLGVELQGLVDEWTEEVDPIEVARHAACPEVGIVAVLGRESDRHAFMRSGACKAKQERRAGTDLRAACSQSTRARPPRALGPLTSQKSPLKTLHLSR